MILMDVFFAPSIIVKKFKNKRKAKKYLERECSFIDIYTFCYIEKIKRKDAHE